MARQPNARSAPPAHPHQHRTGRRHPGAAPANRAAGLMVDLSSLRGRLYASYESQHSGHGAAGATRLIYRRDIRPLLPPRSRGPVLDIGCGAGALVGCLLADGYDAMGIDVSPEQVALAHEAG